MRFPLRLILMAILCCVHLCTWAQDPYYTAINKTHGLPSNSIYRIFQDRKGFIWIANEEGLTRYDGFSFKTFTHPEQASKPGSEINEDEFGRIWYQNFEGYLYYVQNDSLKPLAQNEPNGYNPYGIIKDRLFLLQKKGVDIIDLRTLKLIKTLPFDFTNLIKANSNGKHYYVMVAKSIVEINYDGSTATFPNSISSIIYPAGSNMMLVAKDKTTKYCHLLRNGKTETIIESENIPFIQNFNYTANSNWLSTSSGVWGFDSAGNSLNNNKPFFPEKNISCVFVDRENNYWMGTLDEGILFIPDIHTKILAPGIKPDKLLQHNNKIVIGTKENVIYEYNIDKGDVAFLYRDEVKHEINCLSADANDNYFIASRTFKAFDKDFKLISEYGAAIKDIQLIDHKYYACAGTSVSGILQHSNAGVSTWDSIFNVHREGMRPMSLFIGGRGREVAYNPLSNTIYFINSVGLYFATPKAIKELTLKNAAIRVRTMTQAGNSTFVVTSENNLLEIATDNTIHDVAKIQNEVQVYKAKLVNNELLFITSNGILKYDAEKKQVVHENIFTGIRSEEINDIETAAGNYFIATDKGLIITKGHEHNEQRPELHINSIAANGIKHNHANRFEYNYRENNIEINYSILYFKNNSKYPLYYRINNSKWRLIGIETRNLKLASLAPGSYKVDFRLGDTTSGNNFPVQSVQFQIKKPYWLQWWFFALCGLACLIAIFIYNRQQTGALKKKNKLLAEKMALENNLNKSMLTAIRSQMNPHFFYNALNTIQSFIYANDKRNASTYLVKLSKLTRIILEMTEKEHITLEEEIDALALYLELEKMRFNDDFSFELRSDVKVDPELIRIPPMIIQPYVENAVKHGLLHKKGEKKLSLSFMRINGSICATIDDNGIGRTKAAELNHTRRKEHRSFSTEANNKRIAILNKGRSKNIGVVYIDKKDEQGYAAGTTVIISIPLT